MNLDHEWKAAFNSKDTFKYSDDSPPGSPRVANSKSTVSDQAIVLDDWHLRKGLELSVKLSNGVSEHAATEHAARCADFHAVLFEAGHRYEELTTAKKRAKFIETFTGTTAFEELQVSTLYDSFASFLASKAMLKAYSELDDDSSEQQIRTKAQDALNNGTEAVEAAEQMQSAMGGESAGSEDGEDSSVDDLKRKLDVFEKIKNNEQLRKIFEQAGKFRRSAQSMQRTKLRRGQGEIGDLGLGGNVRRLVASERMRLGCGIPEVEDMTAMKVLGKTALERKRITPDPIGRGPIVCLCDESGSMRENRIVAAKAMVLALMWIARSQKRTVALCGFRCVGRWDVYEHDQFDETKLLAWLGSPADGGTTSRALLNETPDMFYAYDWAKDADIIQITDGQMCVSDSDVATFNAWREANDIRHQVIGVGVDSVGELAQTADEVNYVDSLAVGQSNSVVESLFQSI